MRFRGLCGGRKRDAVSSPPSSVPRIFMCRPRSAARRRLLASVRRTPPSRNNGSSVDGKITTSRRCLQANRASVVDYCSVKPPPLIPHSQLCAVPVVGVRSHDDVVHGGTLGGPIPVERRRETLSAHADQSDCLRNPLADKSSWLAYNL